MFKVQRPARRQMISLRVAKNARITPNFRCITLTGDDLDGLDHTGRDQAVRLFFPRAGQAGLEMPTLSNDAWMAQTLLTPKSRRPWVRTYTIRAYRPEQREIDIEFALHGDAPASAWAANCRPGDPAGIFDEGMTYLPPPAAEQHLLVGEESALPAILSILETAPPALTGQAFLEVPESGDIRSGVAHPSGVRINWLARDEAGTRPGALALDAVKNADLAEGRWYTWVAGESGLPTGVRRHLVNDRGFAKADIAFVGYWRHGRSSPG
ncbi:siderophore-interacting protein [Paractinoplanes durhamensis]|uniref:Siderophore-interacting protein n=1 Tax=Paractinoplanes durhamensis TaxID=113563 RepID=A0ABQ3Z003_9ACTN|nr:siderophore-interacting protein [Actinoplanes durhamensis]GIE03168.1 siderophore-interacting protein [Actinoplanes durhamensis]